MATNHDELRDFLLTIAKCQQAAIHATREVTRDDTNRLRARIQKLEAILEELKDIASEHYDGPEDRRWGPVLSLCESGLMG